MRTIRYRRVTRVPATPTRPSIASGSQTGTPPPAPGAPTQEDIDGYIERLLKYVPAEVVTFFLVFAAMAGARETSAMLTAAVIAGLVAAPFYLFAMSRLVPKELRPHWIMYPLAVIAFMVWAIYMNEDVRSLPFGITVDEGWALAMLFVGVFFIPLVDIVFTGKAPVQSEGT